MGRLADAFARKQEEFCAACQRGEAAGGLQTERDVLAVIAAHELMAENASLRSRLALMAEHVCRGCGCAAAADYGTKCDDCYRTGASFLWENDAYHVGAACISVGLRALCGRKLLEGC